VFAFQGKRNMVKSQPAPGGKKYNDTQQGLSWSRWEITGYVVLILIALLLRLWDLGGQAIHHDESLHAVYSWYITESREYVHNPMMHGPFLFFVTAFSYSIFGVSDFATRLPEALFGVFLVALPILLRGYLGRAGGLITSLLLVASPTMLYFSRFARNDIFMAVWSLALIAMMWRYFDSRKARYLIFSAIILGFAYSTKETTFMFVAVLGSYLLLCSGREVLSWALGIRQLPFSPSGSYMILLGTLTLPFLAAAISLFQGFLGLTLANADPEVSPVGLPVGTGVYVAFMVVAASFLIAAFVGLKWNPLVWMASFGAAMFVWGSLHISLPALPYMLFNDQVNLIGLNFNGVGSGIWQSLGYWIQQHEVCRGCQPWYYYLVVGFNYEFLPMIVSFPAIVIYLIRKDPFGCFLGYWAVVNFIAYSFAGEKMPWLLVEVSLPFFLLAGKLLGEISYSILVVSVQTSDVDLESGRYTPDPRFFGQKSYGVLSLKDNLFGGIVTISTIFLTVIFLVLTSIGLIQFLEPDFQFEGLFKKGLILALPVLLLAILYLTVIVGPYRRIPLISMGLVLAMFSLSLFGAFRLSYINSDVPVEMLVYTQTSADIPNIKKNIDRLAEASGKGNDLKILVDSTDGYSWPWAWYLRDYETASYPCIGNGEGCSTLGKQIDADVILLAYRNQSFGPDSLHRFQDPIRYKHRWWFPESYRGLTLKTMYASAKEKDPWRRIVRYFILRDFPLSRLGSVDSLAYFPNNFEVTGFSEPVE
jgi:predicted membrane-bound mannosyltransferase